MQYMTRQVSQAVSPAPGPSLSAAYNADDPALDRLLEPLKISLRDTRHTHWTGRRSAYQARSTYAMG